MSEAGSEPDAASAAVDTEAEAARIEALEAALDRLDRTEWDARDKLYRELFEVRGRRISRVTRENWDTLEKIVGHKLQR